MNDEEAQKIVYAFVDLVATRNRYIGDASTLPYPKETIREALHRHLDHYYALRRISEETFRELGYDKTAEQLGTMLVYLDDWHEIDAEDKEAVARLNAVEGLPDWAAPLLAKYFQRRAAQTSGLTNR